MKRVLILDDDKDLCKVMSLMMTFLNADASCVHSVEELRKLGEPALNTDLAFLDINLGVHSATGIDAYDWLVQNGYQGRIVFFTGHARSHPLVQRAMTIQNATVLEKPADEDRLRALLES